MDPVHNPFSPGAGTPPPELAGRSDILKHVLLTLARIKNRKAEKSIFIIGLRGTGKTVLLHEIEELAKKENYYALMIEAHEKKSLPEILLPELRQVLFSLDTGEMISYKVKRAFKVFKSFLSQIKLEDAKLALQTPVNKENVAFTEQALDEIIKVTEGYPYFRFIESQKWVEKYCCRVDRGHGGFTLSHGVRDCFRGET
jgi:Cdc6-like AAA superfamily ATPase